MYYDRQIKYFDYKKDGVRQKGAGFLKIEIRDENCTLSLQISGLPPVENSTAQVYGLWENGEELLGNILLQGGRGSKELCFVGKTRLRAIRIPLRDGCELHCQVGAKETQSAEIAREESEISHGQEVPREPEYAEMSVEVTETFDEKKIPPYLRSAEEAVEVKGRTEEQEAEDKQDAAEEMTSEKQVTNVSETTDLTETEYKEPEKISFAQTQPMLEEKWEQLWAVYPHIMPFEDEREYLQMGLGDFVILRERFYRLVHNSFLLHGFYNYQHLILTRLERRGERFYYIGVPGNFYDREKQVALMYGFESFECAKEPAGQGDFGYYMIRVEL